MFALAFLLENMISAKNPITLLYLSSVCMLYVSVYGRRISNTVKVQDMLLVLNVNKITVIILLAPLNYFTY